MSFIEFILVYLKLIISDERQRYELLLWLALFIISLALIFIALVLIGNDYFRLKLPIH